MRESGNYHHNYLAKYSRSLIRRDNQRQQPIQNLFRALSSHQYKYRLSMALRISLEKCKPDATEYFYWMPALIYRRGWAATSASFDLLLICQKQPGKYLIKTIDFTINKKTNNIFVQSQRMEKTKYGKANNLIKRIRQSSSNLIYQNHNVSFEWCHYIICPTITCKLVKQNIASYKFQEPPQNIVCVPIEDVTIQNIADDSLNQAYRYFLRQYSVDEGKQPSKKRKLRNNRFVHSDDLANSASDKDRDSTPKNDARSITHDKPKKSGRQQHSSSSN